MGLDALLENQLGQNLAICQSFTYTPFLPQGVDIEQFAP